MVAIESLVLQLAPQQTLAFPNFTLEQGKAGLLLGNSGSGKTSLLHALAGLRRAYTGRVEVGGQDLGLLSETQADIFRGRHIGLILQQAHLLLPLTVAENLTAAQYLAGQPTDRRRTLEVLERLGIASLRKQRASQLSQGQAQRVAVARALLHSPRVLLADEPTASLDDHNAEAVAQLLLEQSARIGATLLVATHDQRIKPHFEWALHLDRFAV